MTPVEVDQMLKALVQKDLRIQMRARGLSPAGSVEHLREGLKEHMLATGDFALKSETGEDLATVHVTAGQVSKDGGACNNYSRPNGMQNVGNFVTDRPSSRVLAAPGGKSQIVFGASEPDVVRRPASKTTESSLVFGTDSSTSNNYARPNGMQNVGNFLTDRPSSRVLAPPGGGSQIIFG